MTQPAAKTPSRGRRTITLVATLVLILGVLPWVTYRLLVPDRDANRPNILLITLDTTRADALGCYGNPDARTPNLDRLAAEGILFDQCATTVPLTLPAHASLLTGLDPYVHGARQNGVGRLIGANVTLAERLQDGGYFTGASLGAFVLHRKFGTGQGFDHYRDVIVQGLGDPLEAERRGDEVTQDALELLAMTSPEQPFFLWVHYFDPHYPYLSEQHPDPASREAYADEVAYMDAQVGRLLTALDERGVADNTLIVVVGDHGEGLGDHGEPFHGNFLYETTQRVPLILNWPGELPAAQRVAAGTRIIDVAPTILELVAAPQLEFAQGRSLAPLWQQPDVAWNEPAYGETFELSVTYGASPLRSLLVDGWKYIHAPQPELYYLPDDPDELNNLAGQQPERVAELREQLRRRIADAPPPIEGESISVVLDEAEVQKLESLGYAAAGAAPIAEGETELDRFEPAGMNPRDLQPYLKRIAAARGLLRGGDAEAAVPALRELIEELPAATRLRGDLADALAALGRNREAAEAYTAALKADPQDRYLRRNFARFLMKLQLFHEAVGQYRAMLEDVPDDTTALHEITLAFLQLGEIGQADAHIALALEIEPDTPRLLHARAAVRIKQQRYQDAVRLLRRTVALDPTFEKARQDLDALEQALQQRTP